MSQVQAMSPQQAKKLVMMMVEQGILRQQTVRSVQCVGVPLIFGPSEPAKDEVSLYLWFGLVHEIVWALGHGMSVCAVCQTITNV